MEIKDKVAVVTGASSGIGLETARVLAENGARVVLVSRSRDVLEALSKEIAGSSAFPADMTDQKAVRGMIASVKQKFGRIDILVNNAGKGMNCPLETTDIGEYRKLIELNLVGPLVAMQAVIPVMREQGGGTIVNISSGTALMHAQGLGGYSSTKRALAGLSLTAREELAKDRIVVSVVYPYITDTNFYKNAVSCGASRSAGELAKGRPPADTPAFVARRIIDVIETGDPEQFVHDWMRKEEPASTTVDAILT